MTPIQQPTTSRGMRLVEFLGLRRSLVGLLSMVVLVGMGEHMAEQFLPLYLLTLGGGFISVGFLNGMDNLLGALYSFPGGYLSDRLGTKRALLVFNIASMIGFVIVILVPTWPAVLGGAALFLSWTAISLPATMSLVAQVLPKNKRRWAFPCTRSSGGSRWRSGRLLVARLSISGELNGVCGWRLSGRWRWQ